MMKKGLRWILGLFMILAGTMHFIQPESFTRIVPSYLPWPIALVYVSGFFEICGGLGLQIPRLRKLAAWGLVVLFFAVFPANINMAVHQISFGTTATPEFFLWLRLPLQLVLIIWAWWYTRD